MWALDFCAKRSNGCIQMAEECEDAERSRAWMDLAKEWVKLSEEVIARNYGSRKRGLVSEPRREVLPDA
jgi:hypothetical protein